MRSLNEVIRGRMQLYFVVGIGYNILKPAGFKPGDGESNHRVDDGRKDAVWTANPNFTW